MESRKANDQKRQRHLNKKLKAAVEQRKPLRWEFGEYNKYYIGFKLIAYAGYAETGKVYESLVFATNSLQNASHLAVYLFDYFGVRSTTGWDRAVEEYNSHLAKRRRPIV